MPRNVEIAAITAFYEADKSNPLNQIIAVGIKLRDENGSQWGFVSRTDCQGMNYKTIEAVVKNTLQEFMVNWEHFEGADHAA